MLYRHLYSCCSAVFTHSAYIVPFLRRLFYPREKNRTEHHYCRRHIFIGPPFLLLLLDGGVAVHAVYSELLSRTPQLSPLEILRWMAAASFSSVDDDEEKKNRGSKCFPSTFTIFLIQPIFKSKISMSPKMELYGCLKWNPLKIRKENPQSTNWLSPNTMYFLNGHTVWNIVNYVLIFKNVHNTSQCFNYFVPCTRKQIVFQSSTI